MKRISVQLSSYLLFAALIGYFSANPEYIHVDPELALIKISFNHAGERKEECRRLTQEELEALAPNMRRPLECSRERVPLLVEVVLDGKTIYHAQVPPSGLSRDGTSTIYRRFTVRPGSHTLITRLRDSRREEGFDYERVSEITLQAGENFVVDFRENDGGFVYL